MPHFSTPRRNTEGAKWPLRASQNGSTTERATASASASPGARESRAEVESADRRVARTTKAADATIAATDETVARVHERARASPSAKRDAVSASLAPRGEESPRIATPMPERTTCRAAAQWGERGVFEESKGEKTRTETGC